MHTLSTSSHKVKRNIISKCLENFFYSKLKFLKWAPEYFFDDDENHFPVNKIISGALGHAAPTCICCIYILVVLDNLINWNEDGICSFSQLKKKILYILVLIINFRGKLSWWCADQRQTHLIIMSFYEIERGELTAAKCEIQCLYYTGPSVSQNILHTTTL